MGPLCLPPTEGLFGEGGTKGGLGEAQEAVAGEGAGATAPRAARLANPRGWKRAAALQFLQVGRASWTVGSAIG